ncbi:MAG: LysM peptidoglycan-binding domain-containing protein [Nocardioidaceae bacterium]
MIAIRTTLALIPAVVAALVMLALAVGVPLLLVALIGNPIPDQWSWNSPLTGEAILGVLACVAWVFWAQMTLCLIVELIAEIRVAAGHSADWLTRVPGTLGGQQALARTLVQAVVVVGLASAAASTSTPVGIVRAAAAAAAPFTHGPEEAPASSTPTHAAFVAQPVVSRRQTPTVAVEVTSGDSLWSIAEVHLGNGQRWREIAELNEGRVMPDGSRFQNAASILPGWTLLVPDRSPSAQRGHRVIVKGGDTLWGIAQRAYGDGGDWPEVFDANRNKIEDPDLIFPGQRLRVPSQQPAEPEVHDQASHHAPHEPGAPRKNESHIQLDGRTNTPTQEPTSPPISVATPTAVGDQPSPSSTGSAQPHVTDNEIGSSALTRALMGGGAFLAAGLLAALAARRRNQFRNRRSGRTVPKTPDALIDTERAVRTTGSAAAQAARFLDLALRDLASALAISGSTPPEVEAARLDDAQLELFLAAPAAEPPTPWVASRDGNVWRRSRAHEPRVEDHVSPYPTLVSVGVDEDGTTWLVDLEAAGVVRLSGDPTAAADLARFIAAELAMNRWSDSVDVTITNVGQEIVQLNPHRLTNDEVLDIQQLTKTARRVREATDAAGLGVLAGRIDGRGADSWMPAIVVADVGVDDQPDVARDTAELVDELGRIEGRNAVALVAIDMAQHTDGGLVLSIDSDGSLTTPWSTLIANRLGRAEAETLAGLLDATHANDDEPMPTAIRADGSPSDADAGGALTVDVTNPRTGAGDPSSVLPDPDTRYLTTAATTVEDLTALAPRVPQAQAARIIQEDPDLDADLVAWSDPDSIRPKLRLLGPVELRVVGTRPHEVERRTAYYAELTAYLASRPEGVTPEQMADAFSIQHNSLHTRIATLRKWLGANPATDTLYLPESTLSQASRARGVPVYQLHGMLCDSDLFKRLRTRGEARGPDGIDDLEAALALVTSMPFDQLRPGGYGWLADHPADHFLTAAIVDVAHTVATHALAGDRPELAVWAAERAITAAPSEDKPRLDLARAKTALGQADEANRYVERAVHNRSDDDGPPAEPSARTAQVLGLRRHP